MEIKEVMCDVNIRVCVSPCVPIGGFTPCQLHPRREDFLQMRQQQ